MRSYNIPPDASGDGAESDFINRTLKRSGELQFYDSQTVKVEQTTRGVRWHAKIPPAGTAEAPAVKKHPFEIYQPANVSDFATGITFLHPSSGIGTVCNIDATKPTDFNAVPPTVNPSESWRFWAVRTGMIEIRPNYTLIGNSPGSWLYGDRTGEPNNWGYPFTVSDNTDGIQPDNYFLPQGSQEYDSPTTRTLNPPLIMSGTPDVNGFICMSLWIQITPDTSSMDFPAVAIGGRNVQANVDTSISPFYYVGPNLIPVGIIYPGGFMSFNLNFHVQQFLFDHVRGRFPVGNGNFCSGVMNFRGIWSKSFGFLDPTDLDEQVFYPGDCVTVEEDFTWGTYVRPRGVMWQFVGQYPKLWTEPGGLNYDWKAILYPII
jgi:hypothetical protein